MPGEPPQNAAAYAALGIEPGADAEAIDRAYKGLIKKHHPDREGGDAARATEINRAYRELRKVAVGSEKDALEFNEHPFEGRRPTRWGLGLMGVVAGAGALLLAAGPIRPIGEAGLTVAPPQLVLSPLHAAALPTDAMEQPLSDAAISAAARDARRIQRDGDEMALSQASGDCHHSLRDNPSLEQLDRCAAFDDAVVQLQDRDPLRDRGPFAELNVTGRQWSAASALSSDYLAIDGRLDRIRQRVEVVLAPPPPPPTDSQRGEPAAD
jgi:hypothetical protein